MNNGVSGHRIIKYFIKVFKLMMLASSLLVISLVINQLAFAFIDRRTPAISTASVGALIEISPQLLDAIIHVESSHNPRAYNRYTKARGLTQITPVAWKELVKHHRAKYAVLSFWRDMHDPEIARQAGEDYLYLLQKFLRAKRIPVNLDNLLAAYVWGPGNLSRYGLNRAPRVVKRYVTKVKYLARIPN